MGSTTEKALAVRPPYEAPPVVPALRDDLPRQIRWSGVLQTARGPCQCLVVDISSVGARLSVGARVTVGQAVTLVVAGLGLFRGAVAWEEAGMIGVKFHAAQSANAA